MPEITFPINLRGNTFILIPAGTIVITDDPKAPRVVLLEDVKVCSDSRALVKSVE